eukprot:scaffold72381_cov77-Phaeocystis_antarctica.AAC.4
MAEHRGYAHLLRRGAWHPACGEKRAHGGCHECGVYYLMLGGYAQGVLARGSGKEAAEDGVRQWGVRAAEGGGGGGAAEGGGGAPMPGRGHVVDSPGYSGARRCRRSRSAPFRRGGQTPAPAHGAMVVR